MATTFTAREQLVRARLAGLTGEEFAKLRIALDAARVTTESRLATLEAERTQLLARKQKLDLALQHFARPNALDTLRSAVQRGERLKAGPVKPTTKPVKTVKTVKTPGRRPVKRPGG